MVPPILTLSEDEQGPVGYGVNARLNRDLPRRPDGKYRAYFILEGVRAQDQPYPDVKKRNCFSQGAEFLYTRGPTRIGQTMTVVLHSYNAHGITGTLFTNVPLTKEVKPKTRFGNPPYPQMLGCGKPPGLPGNP